MTTDAHDLAAAPAGDVLDPTVADAGSPEGDHSTALGRDDIIVCSFYTADDYYRQHAERLSADVEKLGLSLELKEIEKQPGEDWADICRRKIGFLASVCENNPDRKVFWIDVDCSLLDLPSYVADSTADLIGFQRGFSSALSIGYGQRTRFWEPCFFGINTTPAARRFMTDAKVAEQDHSVKATDDYFFEESWRANADRLTFQLIPSAAVMSRASVDSGITPFFTFGSSGNVAEFKGKVVQHTAMSGGGALPGNAVGVRAQSRLLVRQIALTSAKRIEARLPEPASRRLRAVADKYGVTHVLTAGSATTSGTQAGGLARSSVRARLTGWMMASAQRGDAEAVERFYGKLVERGTPTEAEAAAKAAANSFAAHAGRVVDVAEGQEQPEPVVLSWWVRPFPGNFGDWLSPMVLAAHTDRAIRYTPPSAPLSSPHVVGIGSIGRFIKPSSIVVGTGVSSTDLRLDPAATYVSLRGPRTAAVLREAGGPEVTSFGDPGALMRRIHPMERGETNGRIALVRHFRHAHVPLTLPDTMDEMSVIMSHPDHITRFLDTLNRYDAVVTSAMHVSIVCHSYGIPCALVVFQGLESAVHGSGVKYVDYSEGVGLEGDHSPKPVGLDLRNAPLDELISTHRISDEKLDEIEDAVRRGIEIYTSRV